MPEQTDWALQPAERAICIGMTGTGKSTLCTEIIRRFRASHPESRIFIIDSKPRYRAIYLSNGMGTYYRNWAKGDILEDSTAIFDEHKLKSLYVMNPIVILQSADNDGNPVENFEDLCNHYSSELFRISSPKHPTLLFVDELYDILRGGIAGIADKPMLRAIRQGREKNMAVLTGSQRPRSIPLPILTEATRYYIFQLEYEDDIVYMRKHGPKLTLTPKGNAFVSYHRMFGGKRDERLMQLALRK